MRPTSFGGAHVLAFRARRANTFGTATQPFRLGRLEQRGSFLR